MGSMFLTASTNEYRTLFMFGSIALASNRAQRSTSSSRSSSAAPWSIGSAMLSVAGFVSSTPHAASRSWDSDIILAIFSARRTRKRSPPKYPTKSSGVLPNAFSRNDPSPRNVFRISWPNFACSSIIGIRDLRRQGPANGLRSELAEDRPQGCGCAARTGNGRSRRYREALG